MLIDLLQLEKDAEREARLDEAAERLATILLDQWKAMQRDKREVPKTLPPRDLAREP